jgi:hypothetical protein
MNCLFSMFILTSKIRVHFANISLTTKTISYPLKYRKMGILDNYFAKLYKVLFPFGFRQSVHTYCPSACPPTYELFNVASIFRPG